MVEFLVENGADVNRGDNEGWTPLHATASCGFLSIAKYLIEKGAHVAAVNNDGQLALDIAESQKMEGLLREEIEDRDLEVILPLKLRLLEYGHPISAPR
uniref:Protein phosphatase 1 regulatory subunit 12C-like n=1 Tax=Diabrotica virgifera virgifera TaxID=50390 RepID=A0A6P7FG12_DIAVI